ALEHSLAAQLAASPAGPNVVYREGRCRYLRLEPPKLEALGEALRLTAPGDAALGVELLGGCQTAAAWQGILQATLAPQLDAAGRLRLRVRDPNLPELSKPYLHPRLEQYALDIAPVRDALL